MSLLASVTVKERFLSYVKKTDTCWLWTGYTKPKKGYGNFHHNYKTWVAHRAAYHLFVGPIPKGLFVLHKCDVGSCVNPDHLYIGDHKQNMKDMVDRKRQWYHPPKGHCAREKNGRAKLTEKDIQYIRENYTRYKNFGCNSVSLGKKFGVSPSTICRIIKNEIWNLKESA